MCAGQARRSSGNGSSLGAEGALDGHEEDLAVADAAGAAGGADRVDEGLLRRVLDEAGDQHLGQEVDGVLGAAVVLEMALLPAVAAALLRVELVDQSALEQPLAQ